MDTQLREILTILAEECAEVIQDVAKCFRFGPDQVHLNSKDGRTQIQNLEKELGDVMAMIELLQDENIGVTAAGIEKAKHEKFAKLKQWSTIKFNK